MVWYNPPYNKATATNIGKKFLNIVSRTFTEKHPLRKILNRNTLKVSYACMPNMATTITSHNQRILRSSPPSPPNIQNQRQQSTCNCRNPTVCPLDKNCLQCAVIYQATVTTTDSSTRPETYVGLTEQTFKTRYKSHNNFFNHLKYKNSTELSKYIWSLKERGAGYSIKWRIITKAKPYQPGSKRCPLCLTEKYYIMFRPDLSTLNKRNELASSCRHMNKHLIANFKHKT